MIKLAELKKLCDELPPGEWISIGIDRDKKDWPVEICKGRNLNSMTIEDIRFIIASRTALPELVAWVERAREIIHDVANYNHGNCILAQQLLKEIE